MVWMRKGVVVKRNKIIRKIKKKENRMWWEGGKGVVGKRNQKRKRNQKIRKIKQKDNRMWWEGGKGVVEVRNKKFRKIKILKIRCYECKKQMSSKNKQEI